MNSISSHVYHLNTETIWLPSNRKIGMFSAQKPNSNRVLMIDPELLHQCTLRTYLSRRCLFCLFFLWRNWGSLESINLCPCMYIYLTKTKQNKKHCKANVCVQKFRNSIIIFRLWTGFGRLSRTRLYYLFIMFLYVCIPSVFRIICRTSAWARHFLFCSRLLFCFPFVFFFLRLVSYNVRRSPR